MRLMRRGCLLRLLFHNFQYILKATVCMLIVSIGTFIYYRSLVVVQHVTRNTSPESAHVFAEGVARPHIYTAHARPAVGDDCAVTAIGERAPDDRDVLCRPWQMSSQSCETTKLIFRKTNASCEHQTRWELCKITTKSPTRHRVRCDRSICVTDTQQLGTVHRSSGLLHWRRISSAANLENELSLMIGSSYTGRHFGFAFIRCSVRSGLRNKTSAQQLLLLPQKMYDIHRTEFNGSSASPLNINIIVLDSVSRHHFYRSLPKSVSALREANKPLGGVSVLDFQLVQSLKAKTDDTMRTLWTGMYSGSAVRMGNIFNLLKRVGYRSLWLQDTCWLENWDLLQTLGIDRNLTRTDRWHYFTAALAAAGIDDFDVSLASCEILRLLGVRDQFHGPPALCCNGQHMHNYMFSYLRTFQMSLKSARVPFITYMTTNVAHEATGRRVQTLDDKLSDYLRHLATSQENTLSIILSDHGNSYGDYPERHFVGRLEMFNPLLFIMLPPDVAIRLGKQRMAVLKANQNRLVGMRDVHLFIRGVVSLVQQSFTDSDVNHGLLAEIPVGRNCQDLFSERTPDYCICTNATSPASSDDWHALIAEFAAGELNNMLLDRSRHKSRTVYLCQRLQVVRFDNVTNRHKHNSVITTLDLHVPSFVPGRKAEIFAVTVSHIVTTADVGKTAKFKLLTYTRMTSYAPYAVCASADVDPKICICDMHASRHAKFGDHAQNHKAELEKSLRPNSTAMMGTKALMEKTISNTIDKQGEQCLHMEFRKYTVGASFYSRNDCRNKRFKVRFSLKGFNVDSSAKVPIVFVVHPKTIRFVTVVRQTVKHLDWRWSYGVDYVEVA